MKRPLLYVLTFYIFGILLGQLKELSFVALFFIPIIIFTFLLYKHYMWKVIFIFPFATLLGIVILNLNVKPSNNFIEQNVNKNVEILARVIDIDYTSTGKQKVILKTNSITIDDLKLNTKLKIQAIFNSGVEVEFGQIVLVKGKLEAFDFPRNPGGFNEKLYMQTKRIDYKMFAEILSKGKIVNSFDSYIYKLHKKIKNMYETILPLKEASVLEAMLLGDKQSLDTSVKEIYRKSGISHILAISGLHISIISALLWLILDTLKLNKRVSSTIILTVLIVYCIFTGNSVSTTRAVIMIGIVLFGNIIYYQSDIYTSIATAAFVLLIYQPLYLYDVGFQLSFGAVISIIVLSPVLERLYFIPKPIRLYLISTLAASLGTYPIIAYHFNTISVIGIVVNLLVLPLASILVCFGIISTILGFIWIELGKFLCGIVYFILVFYENICTIASTIPFSQIVTGQPNLILIFIYYTIILATAYYYYLNKQKRQSLKKYMLYMQIFLLIISAIVIFKPKDLEIVYLDVGQGDSIAIHTAKNKNILIDGGGNISKLLDEANTGTQIVLPYLRYKGINRLDCVFVSHPDGDHIIGILELLDYIKINQIFIADTDTKNDLLKILEMKASKYNIAINKLSKGNIVKVDDSISFECIYPSKDILIDSDDYNNNSLVLYMNYNNSKFLFTGDIEKEAEDRITKDYKKLDVDILKVAHHGSKTSSNQNFVDMVKPKVAIISSGKNNYYGHPHKEVLDRYKNINIYNTADEGAILIKPKNNKLIISTMRENEQN